MSDIAHYFRHIQSPHNDISKDLRCHVEGGVKASKLRKESGLACIEGIHLLDAWVQAHRVADIKMIVCSAQEMDHPEIIALIQRIVVICEAQKSLLPEMVLTGEPAKALLTSFGHGPTLLALVQIQAPLRDLSEGVNTLVLDNIQDSGNVGTILRTALAAGYQRILCTPGTASIWSLKVLRAGMGAHCQLEIMEQIQPQALIEASRQVMYVTTLDTAAQSLYQQGKSFCQSHTFVFGNEGQGVEPLFLSYGHKIQIPLFSGVESLNVSAAAAVCLFEARRVAQGW